MSTERQQAILAKLRLVLPNPERRYNLHEPFFNGNESSYVKECVDTGWVSSVGKFVDRFEQDLSDFTNLAAVPVVNGTTALQVCCRLVGVKPGDEVLVPALTFVATANAVAHQGGIPHFVDCEDLTLGVDPFKLEHYLKEAATLKAGTLVNNATGRPIRALIVMHAFGIPSQMDALVDVCNRFGLALIEDAAEALGSYIDGRHVGAHGSVASLSFNGNKILTTGGGGAILSKDPELARHAKHLTTTAKKPHPWAFFHDEVAYNYRMPNINAALGCGQLEQIGDFLKRKRRLANRYIAAFSELKGCRVLTEQPSTISNYWLNCLMLEQSDRQSRDQLIQFLHDNRIFVRPVWDLMHNLPMYASNPRMDLSTSEKLANRLVNLPSSVFLEET